MTQLLLLFIVAAGVLTITPGVDTAMVLRVRNLDRLTGCVFVGFGLKLALAKRA